jgi:hypothetical protein
MLYRRSLVAGGLATAAVPSLARMALADGRPMLVFVGHEL